MEKPDLALDQLHKAKKQASEGETDLKKINCTTDKKSGIFKESIIQYSTRSNPPCLPLNKKFSKYTRSRKI